MRSNANHHKVVLVLALCCDWVAFVPFGERWRGLCVGGRRAAAGLSCARVHQLSLKLILPLFLRSKHLNFS